MTKKFIIVIMFIVMIFDTHSHLNFPDYDKDREEVIKKTLEEGVFMINVGTSIKESRAVVEIAKKYKQGVYASIGLHPLYIDDEVFSSDDYKKIAEENRTKVVAIGETGLDKHKDNFEKQESIFKEHIKLAEELNLPLIIHCRKAHNEVISILKLQIQNYKFQINSKFKIQNSKLHPRGVVHCFTGSVSQAKEYMDMGFYLGFNGIIFKLNLEKVIKEVPLKKMLLETDCPFLTPPNVGTKRNEPVFVREVAKEIARIKEITQEEVERVTEENGFNLFKHTDLHRCEHR
jgi:TatD DNase family protein